jgi:alkanesulfonate monooxygenase SsuD/methylene tetrahydromethanopterin reductase-like flavin-dependent oxidoreductase (luciferase family)
MIEGQEGQTWEEWQALAAACEEHGLEGLFRSDHYGSLLAPGRASLDAWATLAALATQTTRIRLGTLVSPATFRHPSVLAKNAATVDHISGGRVELGIGAGWNEGEHRRHGFEFPPVRVRIERFAEQLEIVFRSFTEDEFDFHGRHYTLEGCRALPKPLQRHIVVGGSAGPGTVGPAARFADEYNTPQASPDECRERRRRWDEALQAAGRGPAPFSLMTGLIVGSDRAEVEARARRTLARMNRENEDVGAFIESRRAATFVGTLDEVRERLAEYEEAGVERVMLQHLDHTDLDTIALLDEL